MLEFGDEVVVNSTYRPKTDKYELRRPLYAGEQVTVINAGEVDEGYVAVVVHTCYFVRATEIDKIADPKWKMRDALSPAGNGDTN